MEKTINDIDFSKGDGLVPVIVQDTNTKQVLTLAYTNKESLELTKKTGNSWFWSRSRKKLYENIKFEIVDRVIPGDEENYEVPIC